MSTLWHVDHQSSNPSTAACRLETIAATGTVRSKSAPGTETPSKKLLVQPTVDQTNFIPNEGTLDAYLIK